MNASDIVNASEKAAWTGGGAFVVGTFLDATAIAAPVGVTLQTYGASVMAVSSGVGAIAQIGKALHLCY